MFWGKVEWGKDRFVATTNKSDSSSAVTAVSFDGKTWYEGTMSEPGEWTGLGYNKGMWCAVKSDTGSTSDVVAFSRDGFHWDGKILTTANELRAGVVGYAHGNWVVAPMKLMQ